MFYSLESISPQELCHGYRARMYHGNEITFAVVEIDPNAPLPSHHHDNEQVGLLVRGSLTFTVDGEPRTALVGEGWVIPGNTEHAAVAGPDGAVVIETWAPPRRDFQELPDMPAVTPVWPDWIGR